MFWQDRPFVRILLFFLAGIFLAYYVPFIRYQPVAAWAIAGAIFLALSFAATLFLRSYRYRWLNGMALYPAILLAGILLTLFHLKTENVSLNMSRQEVRNGEILTEPQPAKKSVKCILKLSRDKHSETGNGFFRVMAYFEKDSASTNLHPGDCVALNGRFQRPSKVLNPGEFDFRNYLKNQGIRYMLFVKSGKWKKLSYQDPFNLKAPFSSWRNKLLETLGKNGLQGDEFEVGAAILLGYEQLLEPDVRRNYATAGVVHILCVSGMHVGIIYLVLSFLLGFLTRFRHGKRLKNVLLLLLIWCYALLTGLSPSVLRASVMISFFIIAGALEREYDNYNLLAASAFLLLVFNPFFIFNVGFQLSYAAVLGILTFYFPLYRMVYFKYRVPGLFWAALSVSFSAELGVFPIAVHYFHLFPVYFLITNLLVFALAYLILSSGMALLVFSWLPGVSRFLGSLLNTFLGTLNHIVNFVAGLPYARIQDVFLPWSHVWLIYLLTLLLYFLIIQKNIRLLLPVLTVILVLLSMHTVRNYRLLRQEKLVVYAIPRHTAVDFISGKKHVLLADTSALKATKVLDYDTEGYRIMRSLKKHYAGLETPVAGPAVFYQDGFAKFGTLRLFILNPGRKHFPALDRKIAIDYLIYRGSGKIPLKEISKSIRFKNVVFDGSVSPYREKTLVKNAGNLHIKVFSLLKSGALIVDRNTLTD